MGVMRKCLATMIEQESDAFRAGMVRINETARQGGLAEYNTYSRLWEYPWVWLQLEPMGARGLRLLDVGSQKSALPWFLAVQGFDVTVSDLTAAYWRLWGRAARLLRVSVCRRILDVQALDLPTASVDIYLTASVIEHVPDKAAAIIEAARVLRPGGLLVMTFDICEPEMGMTFPAWNGQALTMQAFDDLFRDIPWFEPGLAELPWNTDDIPAYLAWNRTTSPHHNYVVGGAVVRRSDQVWEEPVWSDGVRVLRGWGRTVTTLGVGYLRSKTRALSRRLGQV